MVHKSCGLRWGQFAYEAKEVAYCLQKKLDEKPMPFLLQVNLETFSIDDLVPAAVETGDLVALVHQVKKRFNDYNALGEEMEELQKK